MMMKKIGEFVDLMFTTMIGAVIVITFIGFLTAWYYISRTDTYYECIDGKLYKIHDNTRDAYTTRRLIANTSCTQKETKND